MAITSSSIYNSVSKSLSGSGIHHDVTYKVQDKRDNFKSLVAFDPVSANTSDLSKFSTLCVINTGSQPVELLVELNNFATGGAKAGSNPSKFITMILNGSQLLYLPTSKIIEHNDGSGAKESASDTASTGPSSDAAFIKAYSDATARGDSKVNTAVGVVASGALLNAGSGIVAADVAMNIDNASDGAVTATNYFKVNDLIQMGSEVMLVTEITSGIAMSIERGLLGTTAADHSNNSVVNHYYLNEQGDTFVKTNRNGFYSATSFFGYGRALAYPMGITPGSVAIKFYQPAYQEFGMSNQTFNTETGLTASTIYSFDITPDNKSSATTISFTTDSSNTKWGGQNGVLQKINDQLQANFDNETFKFLPTISLSGGDIRFTSGSRITGTTADYGSKIVLQNASSGGSNLWGVNRLPAIGEINAMIPIKAPLNYQTGLFMFDDGAGGLNSADASGSIDYETGAIAFRGPPNSEFEISAYFNTPLSGIVTGDRDNYIIGIHAKSTNQFRDGIVRVIALDDTFDDTTLKSRISGINR